MMERLLAERRRIAVLHACRRRARDCRSVCPRARGTPVWMERPPVRQNRCEELTWITAHPQRVIDERNDGGNYTGVVRPQLERPARVALGGYDTRPQTTCKCRKILGQPRRSAVGVWKRSPKRSERGCYDGWR